MRIGPDIRRCGARAGALCVLLAACACGCSGGAGARDDADREDPMMRRAEAKADAGDIAGALAAYAEVLDRSPRSARAHLDMALLLHDHSKDYVAAIYHYRRYIELRPGAEKADMIRDRIRVARQLLAGEVLRENRGLAEVPEERLEALQKDNDRLRQEIEELKRELAARRRPRNRATAQPGTDGP